MKQSEIWLVNLDPTVGAEIRKMRPALIINDDSLGKLPLKIIVPITDWKEKYSIAPWMVKIVPNIHNGLSKESSIDCFQIRSLSEERLVKYIGCVDSNTLVDVQFALKKVLSM